MGALITPIWRGRHAEATSRGFWSLEDSAGPELLQNIGHVYIFQQEFVDPWYFQR